ncbi:hypothetical protein SK128_009626 [Halocaridina rubra]|uniref:Uncharacterized protein n=1 Tax=Halocaridina rubra TaxID=373956 RepID=A0AAN8WTP8_HALRR
MDFETKESRRSSRKTRKTSELTLMPWEKRHQHTMEKFLAKDPKTPLAMTFSASPGKTDPRDIFRDIALQTPLSEATVPEDVCRMEPLFREGCAVDIRKKRKRTTVTTPPKNKLDGNLLCSSSDSRKTHIVCHHPLVPHKSPKTRTSNAKQPTSIVSDNYFGKNLDVLDAATTIPFRSASKYQLDDVLEYKKMDKRKQLWNRIDEYVCNTENWIDNKAMCMLLYGDFFSNGGQRFEYMGRCVHLPHILYEAHVCLA